MKVVGMMVEFLLLFVMLTARAEVGGLALPHDRYRNFLPGGAFSGPGLLGPSGPKSPSTPAAQGPGPIGLGPQGPGDGGSGPLGPGGPGDSSGDPSGAREKTLTGETPKRDYYDKWRLEEEVGGKLYTGDSPPNTVYDYPRKLALVETHVPTKIRTLLCYTDECCDDYLDHESEQCKAACTLEKCKFEDNALYTYTWVYLRDIRNTSAIHVRDIDPASAVIFFDSNQNQNDSDINLPYLTNRELVWNIKFDTPKDIRIRITTINLGDVDSAGKAKDFLVLYNPDTPDPTIFNTNITNPSIQPYDNITNFILRFSSDETRAFPRGFQGRIIVLNNISAQSSQPKRSVRSTEKKKKEKEAEEEEEEEEEEKEEKEKEEKEKEEKGEGKGEEKEEEEMEIVALGHEVEQEGMLGVVAEQSERELKAHIKMFELCVDEMLEFGEEVAAQYADHPVCGPASKSYFHYLKGSFKRHD